MFIRFNTSKRTKNPIVQIVESYRVGGKVRQRIIASLGAATSRQDLESLEKVATDLLAKLQIERNRRRVLPTLFPDDYDREAKPVIAKKKLIDPVNLKHEATIYDGFKQIISILLEKIGISDAVIAAGRASYSSFDILQMLLSQMWDSPSSKLQSFNNQQCHGFLGIELHHVYRCLDHLVDVEKLVLRKTFRSIYGGLTSANIDCIFVDVTTLYFESVEDDELRAFGFSKDQKFHSVQVVLCLVVNSDGIPLTYKTFRGNTAEVNTLLPVLEQIKSEFQVESATIVTDRGMASRENIEKISGLGFKWITAAKIKHLPKTLKLNDIDTFQELKLSENESDECIKYKRVDHPRYPDCYLMVTYSPRRARKDCDDRESIVSRISAKLITEGSVSQRPKKLVSNSGYRQFVKFSEPGKWQLNESAVAAAKAWDGFHAIAYSKKIDLSIPEILTQYKNLWRIEDAFRVSKSFLEVRPMYHWTPKRIRAHILLSFIGLFLERYLETRLRVAGTPLTPCRIRTALKSIHTVTLKDNRTIQEIKIPSRISDDAKKIFRLLKITRHRRTIVD